MNPNFPKTQSSSSLSYPAQQSASSNQNLLQYYNIDSIQQLVSIMLDPKQSEAYNHIRYHPIPHIELQNLNTIKSTIQYRRQLLLNLMSNAKEQLKIKRKDTYGGDKEANIKQEHDMKKQKEKQQVKNSISHSILPHNHKHEKHSNLKIHVKPTKKKQQDVITTSNHSYQELQNYFATNNDALLCKRILSEKYSRCEVIRSHRLRKYFWLLLIGFQRKRQQYPLMYETLCNYEGYHDFFTRIIHADVVRTVHDSDQKQKKQTMEKMTKVLQCFARRNPYIGYCQGMNFILNFIMTMQFEEQECFWILVTVLQQIVHMGYYTNMSGVAIDIKIISYIMEQMYPQINKKLASLEIDLSIFMLQWLVCLYTSTLPFYLLVIVWDLLLIEGTTVLFKVALILLEYIAPITEQAKDFAHFFKLYQNLKKKIFIEQEIFIKKFNNIYIDKKIIPLVRQIIEKEMHKSKQQIRKNIKESQKWKEADCCTQWPICFQKLKKQKLDDIECDVWILKDQNGPRIISDYLNQKQRKSTKPAQDERQIVKKLVIGRIPHICQENPNGQTQKKRKNNSDGIQLDDVQIVKNGDQYIIRPRNNSIKQEQETQLTSADFFRRATSNNLAFHALLGFNNFKKNAQH